MRGPRARTASPAEAVRRARTREIPRQPTGVQSLERALRVLRDIASSGAMGRRLVDLQRNTDLTKPTAHRIAQALVRYDFARYDRKSRRYVLGAEISILSVSAPKDLPDLRALSRDDMRALAEKTGDTAYLMVRSAGDVVCVAREMGPYPIKALTGEIGTRRPLGVGAGGIVLLASLRPEEIDAVLKSGRKRTRSFANASGNTIRAALRDMRAKGYAFSDGYVVRAVRGIGLPIRDRKGNTVAALSIGAIRERMTRSHIEMTVAALHVARRAIERKLRKTLTRPPTDRA